MFKRICARPMPTDCSPGPRVRAPGRTFLPSGPGGERRREAERPPTQARPGNTQNAPVRSPRPRGRARGCTHLRSGLEAGAGARQNDHHPRRRMETRRTPQSPATRVSAWVHAFAVGPLERVPARGRTTTTHAGAPRNHAGHPQCASPRPRGRAPASCRQALRISSATRAGAGVVPDDSRGHLLGHASGHRRRACLGHASGRRRRA
jgi:hypothetical protein